MREAVEVGVEREARTDLYAAVLDPGVEAVERADRWATRHLARGAIDAAVARADEALRRLDVADGAAQVHAAVRDGDVRLIQQLLAVLGPVGLPHIDGGLAAVADVGDQVDDLLHVRRLGEVGLGTNVLPAVRLGLAEVRPEGEAERREPECSACEAADGQGATGHEATARDRLALERARHVPVRRVGRLPFPRSRGHAGVGLYRDALAQRSSAMAAFPSA